MQYLGPGMGQFRGLVETDAGDKAGIGTEARVGGHDAVHVGPDFNALPVEHGAQQGGSEIRAAAAERGGRSLQRGANEAAKHRGGPAIEEREKLLVNPLTRWSIKRRGGAVVLIGDDAFARV